MGALSTYAAPPSFSNYLSSAAGKLCETGEFWRKQHQRCWFSFATWIWSPSSSSDTSWVCSRHSLWSTDSTTIHSGLRDLNTTITKISWILELFLINAALSSWQVWETLLQHQDKLTHCETLNLLLLQTLDTFPPLNESKRERSSSPSPFCSSGPSPPLPYRQLTEKVRESKARWGGDVAGPSGGQRVRE